MSDPVVVGPARVIPPVEWPAIFAGTVLAAGVSLTLLAFGAAVGLSTVSTAPTWRDSSAIFWFLSGLFLVFNALCSFGIGGYAVGRMRARLTAIRAEEAEFSDGMHGLFVWGLAILVAAFLAIGGAGIITHATAPSGGTDAPTSVAGENLIASELDELFQSEREAALPDIAYRRAEAARILLKSSSHQGVPPEDRAYLSDSVALTARISQEEASDRVNTAIAKSADALHRARTAAVLQAFMIAAALLVGLAVAWFSAEEGGRDRERGSFPIWDWSWRGGRRQPTV